MRFMIIYRPETANGACAAPSPEGMAAMASFQQELTAAGVLLATEGLLPSDSGAVVRLSNGAVTATDGASAASGDAISGYAIVKVDAIDDAIELAERFLRIAGDGETEIRQLFEPADFGDSCVDGAQGTASQSPELAGARR